MRLLTALLLLAGFGIFAAVMAQADLGAVWGHVQTLGVAGAVAVLVVSCGWYATDVLIWRQTLRTRPTLFNCFGRLWRAQVVGEAINNITPLASLGGEPVKASLLNRLCGVPYRECVASLVIVQMINLSGLILFLVVGLGLMFSDDLVPDSIRVSATIGFLAVAVSVALFYVAQRYRFASRSGRRLSRSWLGAKAMRAVRHVHRIEGYLVHFYRERPTRFASAIGLSFGNWSIGAIEIFVVLWFLDSQLSFASCWIIEAAVVLTRVALFVLPSSLGAQEGVFYVVAGALTGSPAIAVALALIRRGRELVWIAIGLALGARLSLKHSDGHAPRSPYETPTT